MTTATGTRVMTDWSSIVREHGPLVWRTAYRLLNREADAADCFQQTFLAAFEFAERQAVRDWPALLRLTGLRTPAASSTASRRG